MESLSITSIFLQLFDELNISYCLRREKNDTWSNALRKITYYPIEYSNLYIDYQLSYQAGEGWEGLDYSMVLMFEGNLLGVWPITLAKKNDQYSLTSQGLPIAPVILRADVTDSIRKLVYRKILTFMLDLCSRLDIKELRFSEGLMPNAHLSEWHRCLMSLGAKCHVFHELFLDTSQSIDNIVRSFSSNFRRYYRQGLGLWETKILCHESRDIDQHFEQFKALHYKVSGGSTRSDASWETQKRYIKSGDSILAYSTQDDGQFVGGGLFFLSPHTCLYASGAYDRQLFKTPVSHVIQIKAIEYFCKKTIPWYRIGRRPFPGDTNEPSTKEISIGQFKERVATHVFPSFEFTLVL